MQSELLDGLNKEQKEAVITTEGYIRIIAGAGSGKTNALTRRFAYLVNEIGISTKNILCVTFTNKAANEMKQRIRRLIGDKDTSYISTFHGFCVTILREDIHVMHYPKSFIVIDNEDVDSMLKSIYEEMNINSRHMTFNDARRMISLAKLDGKYVMEMVNTDNESLRHKAVNAKNISEGIWYRYLYEQKKCYGLDFNDLLNFVLYIFDQDEDIKGKWQKRLQYVMVDEFQDVSVRQYEFAKILSGYHHNLFIVGDPDQTIYTWRGADVNIILNFNNDFKDAKTIMLNRNYRSSPNILYASNSLIKKNKIRIDRDLVPIKQKNIPVSYYHAKTIDDEGNWIANQIKQLQKKGKKLSEIAILYRAHFVSRSIEESLMKEEIPYSIYSGTEFYSRKLPVYFK